MKGKLFGLLCLFAAGLSASCSARVESFALEAGGKNIPLSVESEDNYAEPGVVSLAPGAEILFRFDAAVSVEEGFALYVEFRDAVSGLVLAAPREDGTAAESPLFAAADGAFYLSLPPGRYEGFALRKDGGASTDKKPLPALRVTRAAVVPYQAVLRFESAGRITASSDFIPARTANGIRVRLPRAREDTEYSLRVTPFPAASAEEYRLELRGASRSLAAEVRLRPVAEPVYFHTRFLGFVPGEAEIPLLPAGLGMEFALLPNPEWALASSSFVPVPADAGIILASPRTVQDGARETLVWRHPDFEVFRWSLFPEVLIFDSRDYTTQNRLFHRLAFFVEKTGFRGKLHTDAAIRGRHGWNAHNYNAQGLAAFFETARLEAFPLSAEEEWLAAYLVSQGVLAKNGEAFVPGAGGILGISRESSPATRDLLLTHEAFHGVYYGLPEFRRLVDETWESLPAEQKSFWLFYFAWMGYDTADRYLLVNEFQSYLLQQQLSFVEAHYRETIAARLTRAYPERREWLELLLARNPGMFSRPARVLSEHLEAAAGIRAGEIPTVRITVGR